MTELLNDITELYELGGSLNEILTVAKEERLYEKQKHIENMNNNSKYAVNYTFYEMFQDW